jgi:predicted metal-binding protein
MIPIDMTATASPTAASELATTDIVVCTTCRPAGTPREQTAPGQLLYDAVQAALQPHAEAAAEQGAAAPVAPQPRLTLRGLACMSGCDRACTVALQAPGKFSYYFGDLRADAETAAQLIACAQLHRDSGDGSLLRNARPERLRSGILARLPPVSPAVERTAAMVVEAR